jgi:NADH-ubiquinone oxidoreductase chain 5
MRKYGGLINILPLTYISILIASFSLMAIPYLSGYYSKDLILELGYSKFNYMGNISY